MTFEKVLLALSAVVCAVVILAFSVDLLTGWPFHRYSLLMDVGSLFCGSLLAYLIWLGYRSLRP